MISFDWEKFYDVGFCMKNISQKEEFQRSAVGRYYYAAFGKVKKYYENKYNITIPSKDSHRILINYLIRSQNKQERDIGRNLNKFRRIRNYADYDSIFYLSNVKKAEKFYKNIIELLNSLEEK